MKQTGITRKLDELGRIVIPKEIRETYKIEEGDHVEFFLDNNEIVIKKPSSINGLDDEIYKLFQAYNLRFHHSIAIVENSNILISYGKDTNKISDSLTDINIYEYNTKSLSRYKHKENNFVIANIENNKFLIVYEHKVFSSTDSSILNFVLDYLVKLLKKE